MPPLVEQETDFMDSRTQLLDQLRLDRTHENSQATLSSPRRTRRGLWIAASTVLLALAVGTLSTFGFSRRPVSVRSATARSAPGSSSSSLLDASGYVVALREATVSAKNIYKVSEVLIQEGQPVKRGDILARLDDTNTRATLDQSKAQVRQFEASLSAAKQAEADARPGFLRNRSQLAEGLISQQAFEASQTTYNAAFDAVRVAEENLGVARSAVVVNQRFQEDTVIAAPFDGVVTAKNAQPGEIVSPQFLGGGGIAKVVDMGSLEVDVDVNENFINRVRPKQPAVITLNAYPDWRIPAEVIAVIPTADRAKATVKVRVAFKEKDERVVPEMGARVSFLDKDSDPNTAHTAAPGILVPADALAASDTQGEKGAAAVFLIDGNTVKRHAVRLGQRSGDDQIIVEGLQAGATVAAGDLSKLRDGSKVQITP